MTTTKITDHTVQALARRAGRDMDKPNIALLISAFSDQIQETEDAWFQLFEERSIDNGIGQQLDDLGVIVGQPRNGEADVDYRRFLRTRIAVNNSDGLINDLIRVGRGVINDESLTILMVPGTNAQITMKIESGSISSGTATILIDFLRDTVSGGVRIILHHLTTTEALSFTFTDAASHPDISVQSGFESVALPGTGGLLASVLE
jgi:hypothetical protein